ncbi:hypothetical protein F0L68_33015 [Solihabitans fulvus]|uniref:Uncharacterized protein n=1 Tax=Solihabitans fulvus TaxID=1892852 RepID=A0A5B2WSU7_9PSEU|nr:hypothetical protein [Solihabitans fulvus]KAA2253626.1 hypothetical protein F0L68_33015 [Solihabitans fulvus]
MRFTLRKAVVACAAVASALVLGAGTAAAAGPNSTGQPGVGRPALAVVTSATGANTVYAAWNGNKLSNGLSLLYFASTTDLQHMNQYAIGSVYSAGDGPGLVAAGTGVYLAWADGTPGAHNLHLAYFDGSIVNGSFLQCQTTLGDSSPNGATLARSVDGQVYLGWTGWDQHLNIAKISNCANNQPMVPSEKVVLSETSATGVTLAWDDTATNLGVIVGWTDANQHPNAANFTAAATLANTTTLSTATTATATSIYSGLNEIFVSYKGTDNVGYQSYNEGGGFYSLPQHINSTGWAMSASSSYAGLRIHNSDNSWNAFFDVSNNLNLFSL